MFDSNYLGSPSKLRNYIWYQLLLSLNIEPGNSEIGLQSLVLTSL